MKDIFIALGLVVCLTSIVLFIVLLLMYILHNIPIWLNKLKIKNKKNTMEEEKLVGYIKYEPEITKEIFDQIVDSLLQLGYREKQHCGWEVTYSKFVEKGYFRFGKYGGALTKTYCVDNNNQNQDFVDYKTLLTNSSKSEFLYNIGDEFVTGTDCNPDYVAGDVIKVINRSKVPSFSTIQSKSNAYYVWQNLNNNKTFNSTEDCRLCQTMKLIRKEQSTTSSNSNSLESIQIKLNSEEEYNLVADYLNKQGLELYGHYNWQNCGNGKYEDCLFIDYKENHYFILNHTNTSPFKTLADLGLSLNNNKQSLKDQLIDKMNDKVPEYVECVDLNGYTEITFDQFKQWVLPKKWCIEVTEENQPLLDIFYKNHIDDYKNCKKYMPSNDYWVVGAPILPYKKNSKEDLEFQSPVIVKTSKNKRSKLVII